MADLKEHVKQVAERYKTNLTHISGHLGTTRNSLYIKLKNNSVKLSYLPELAEVIGCSIVELIPPPEGFTHQYDKTGKYKGLLTEKSPD